MLHFNGPGEILIWAEWTDGDIRRTARRSSPNFCLGGLKGLDDPLHWNPDRTVDELLTCSNVDKDYSGRDLSWWCCICTMRPRIVCSG